MPAPLGTNIVLQVLATPKKAGVGVKLSGYGVARVYPAALSRLFEYLSVLDLGTGLCRWHSRSKHQLVLPSAPVVYPLRKEISPISDLVVLTAVPGSLLTLGTFARFLSIASI